MSPSTLSFETGSFTEIRASSPIPRLASWFPVALTSSRDVGSYYHDRLLRAENWFWVPLLVKKCITELFPCAWVSISRLSFIECSNIWNRCTFKFKLQNVHNSFITLFTYMINFDLLLKILKKWKGKICNFFLVL